MTYRQLLQTLVMGLVAALTLSGMAAAQVPGVTAGPNLDAPPSGPPIDVPWDAQSNSWNVEIDLTVDPSAGMFVKRFQSPREVTGAPILLDAQQPFPLVLWEDFRILSVPGTPGVPVTDWHEEIHTPGWVWVLPGDSRFDTLFPPNSSLITRNGDAWPWEFIPMDQIDPSKLWVQFPPIQPGNVLDVHKALLWVGTKGNRIWGDGIDDSGDVDESFIEVWEYPTIPEPATGVLLLIGIVAVVLRRHR